MFQYKHCSSEAPFLSLCLETEVEGRRQEGELTYQPHRAITAAVLVFVPQNFGARIIIMVCMVIPWYMSTLE